MPEKAGDQFDRVLWAAQHDRCAADATALADVCIESGYDRVMFVRYVAEALELSAQVALMDGGGCDGSDA